MWLGSSVGKIPPQHLTGSLGLLLLPPVYVTQYIYLVCKVYTKLFPRSFIYKLDNLCV